METLYITERGARYAAQQVIAKRGLIGARPVIRRGSHRGHDGQLDRGWRFDVRLASGELAPLHMLLNVGN